MGSGQWAVERYAYLVLSTSRERLFYLFELEIVGGVAGFENPSPSPSLRGRGILLAREVERVAGDAGGVFYLAVFDGFGRFLGGGVRGFRGGFPEAAAVGVAFGGSLVLFGLADAGGTFGLGFRLRVPLLDRRIFRGSFRLSPRELRQGGACRAGEGSCGCADVHDLRLRGGME